MGNQLFPDLKSKLRTFYFLHLSHNASNVSLSNTKDTPDE